MSAAWESAKSTASTTFSLIKAAITDPVGTARSIIQGYVSAIKGFLSFTGLSTTVTNAFNAIKSAITGPIESAKTFCSNAIEKIKSIFPIKLGKIFSGIQLPHFRISGGRIPWGIGGKGEKPSVSIDWYRKAYDNPYLFTTPTIIGNRGFGDGGGSGELLYGRDQLLRDIALASSGDDITINIYAADGMNINQLANKVQLKLAQLQKQKASAYA